MSDPKRLLDQDGDGTPEERGLIEAARERGMPAAAKAAVWSAVVVQGLVASAQVAAAASSAAKGSALAGLLSWKGLLVVAVGATAATGAWLFDPRLPAAPPASPRPAAAPGQIARAVSPPTAAPPPKVEPPPQAVARPAERGRPVRLSSAATDTQLLPSRLAEEAQSLVEARRLLRSGAIAAAQAALEKADREFAGGRLGQEREALLIEALARGGQRDLARGRAAAFLRNYPSSPHAVDVRRHVEGK
jgi:hypothetical protein